MPTLESERPPINQNAIHLRQSEFADKIASMGPDAFNQRFTVSLDGSGESSVDEAVPELKAEQEPLERVGIDYVSGEPPLEAFITGSRPDPNRPGKLLFSVIPANPEDAADFPKVAPEEALVPSRIEMKKLGDALAELPQTSPIDEINSDATMLSAQERRERRERLEDAEKAVDAVFAAAPDQNELQPEAEKATESKSEEEKATEALDELGVGISDKDRIALQQYANGRYANKSHEMTAAEKRMSGAVINNKELKLAYSKAWARLMDARKTAENQ